MTVLGIGTEVNVANLDAKGLVDEVTISNIPPAVTYTISYFFNGDNRRVVCGEYELSFDKADKLEIGFK